MDTSIDCYVIVDPQLHNIFQWQLCKAYKLGYMSECVFSLFQSVINKVYYSLFSRDLDEKIKTTLISMH